MFRPNARSPSITSQESYSAVMITDLVADVPVSEEIKQETANTPKEETNLGYDVHMDGDAKNPTLEENNCQKTNGAGISKGVLLNAMQFGQNDSKTKSDEKPIQLSATLQVPTLTQPVSESKGFKDMSIQRKIAFGFSFLPSVLFVLCFAVILPCNVPKSCVEETWIVRLNDTELTSRIEISDNIAVTSITGNQNKILIFSKNDGSVNEVKIPAESAYLRCDKILKENKYDCILIDKPGNVYFFNNSMYKAIWNPRSENNKLQSSHTLLTGCSNNTKDVVISASNTSIKVLYNGNQISDFTVPYCTSHPVKLMSWTRNGSSDIIFVCDKDGEDRLVKVPKDAWCVFSKDDKEEPVLLETGELGVLKNSIFQPLEDGLVMWYDDEISLMQVNGSYLWKVSNLSHHDENRFILQGNFLKEKKQIALLSSNLNSGLKVTLLNPSDGQVVKSVTHKNVEAIEVVSVQGLKKDYLLLLLIKSKVMDTVTTALSQISDISTTIASLLTNQDLMNSTSVPLLSELSLLEVDGSLETVKELDTVDDSAPKGTMSVILDKDAGILRVYLAGTSYKLEETGGTKKKTTYIRNINIANWDKSIKPKCLAKK